MYLLMKNVCDFISIFVMPMDGAYRLTREGCPFTYVNIWEGSSMDPPRKDLTCSANVLV